MENAAELLQALYDSEINFGISCFWDGGFDVSLGDDMNGYKDVTNVDSIESAAYWLGVTAIKYYPQSKFAREWKGKLD